jgi:hypothetical protein
LPAPDGVWSRDGGAFRRRGGKGGETPRGERARAEYIVIRAVSGKDAGMKDQRDKEIDRFGEHIGQTLKEKHHESDRPGCLRLR